MRRTHHVADIVAKARKAMPHVILQALAKEYKSYIKKSRSRAEEWFWVKCSRATANLGSGMEKWLDEMLDETDSGAKSRKRRKRK